MTIIGITGTGSVFGQSIIKSIKKSSFRKSKLIGIDYFDDTVGSFWTDENFILPDILDKNIKINQWLEKIIDIIKSRKIRILFVGIDFELPYFAKYKNIIKNETSCLIVVSDLNVINIGEDKYLTYKFLKENGLNFPKTYLESELDKALTELVFPIIVKPRNGFRSIDVHLVHNEKELLKKIKQICKPIMQEYISDADKEYTCGTISFEGSVKKSIVLRRELKEGHTVTTYLDKYTPNEILKYVQEVSATLKGQFGVSNFQLRADSMGVPKIFEINPRHSGTTYIRSLYGYNEVEYILEYLINNREKEFNIRYGLVKRYFEEFFVSKL